MSDNIWEDKYIPSTSATTTIEEKAGVAAALKRLAGRRFVTIVKEMDGILEKTYFEEDD